MREILLPAVGVAMSEGTLAKWLKEPGEEVAAGEFVVEIETDKASFQVESPVAGKLGEHLHDEGATLPVETVLARVFEAGDDPASVTESSNGSVSAPIDRVAAPVAVDSAVAPAPQGGVAPFKRPPHRLTPRARAIARAHGIRPEEVGGAGRARDVLAAIEDLRVAPVVAVSEPDVGFRRLIAERVSESWRTIPHFTVSRDLDAETLIATAEELRRRGGSASVTDLLVRALALSVDGRGDAAGAVGLAVATDRGVVIPVIRDVPELRLDALAEARRLAVERARIGRLAPTDLDLVPLTTLSNLGPFGVDSFTGIIPLGQTTMLTVGRVRNEVVTDGRAISIGKRMFATLNVDHRVLDGADGAQILSQLASILLDPQRLAGE